MCSSIAEGIVLVRTLFLHIIDERKARERELGEILWKSTSIKKLKSGNAEPYAR